MASDQLPTAPVCWFYPWQGTLCHFYWEPTYAYFAQGLINMLFCVTYADNRSDDTLLYGKAIKGHSLLVGYGTSTVALQPTDWISRTHKMPVTSESLGLRAHCMSRPLSLVYTKTAGNCLVFTVVRAKENTPGVVYLSTLGTIYTV